MKKILLTVLMLALYGSIYAQFIKGVDLSFVNQLEDCGVQYGENGVSKDPFEVLSQKGANLVRVRLWHTPEADLKIKTQVMVVVLITLLQQFNEQKLMVCKSCWTFTIQIGG